MREPTNPGWAEKQTPTPFLCILENDRQRLKLPTWGVCRWEMEKMKHLKQSLLVLSLWMVSIVCYAVTISVEGSTTLTASAAGEPAEGDNNDSFIRIWQLLMASDTV